MADIVREPTMCMAPGHWDITFRKDRIIIFPPSCFPWSSALCHGEVGAECEKPGELSKWAHGDTWDGNF